MFNQTDSKHLRAAVGGIFSLLLIGLAVFLFLSDARPAESAPSGEFLIVELRGTGVAREPDPAKGEAGDWCFDAPLYSLKTDKRIGMAADCLEVIEIVDDTGTPADPTDDSLKVRGVTRFEFPQGRLVSVAETTVAPTTWDTPGFTQTTLAVPSSNNILSEHGTGAFKGATGTVRISGAVDTSNFNPMTGEGAITFSCIFPIRIDS